MKKNLGLSFLLIFVSIACFAERSLNLDEDFSSFLMIIAQQRANHHFMLGRLNENAAMENYQDGMRKMYDLIKLSKTSQINIDPKAMKGLRNVDRLTKQFAKEQNVSYDRAKEALIKAHSKAFIGNNHHGNNAFKPALFQSMGVDPSQVQKLIDMIEKDNTAEKLAAAKAAYLKKLSAARQAAAVLYEKNIKKIEEYNLHCEAIVKTNCGNDDACLAGGLSSCKDNKFFLTKAEEQERDEVLKLHNPWNIESWIWAKEQLPLLTLPVRIRDKKIKNHD